MTTVLTWVGIALCISQSAMFSGLNLAFFSISRLQLEIECRRGNKDAERVRKMRKDSNFLLTTILWGNVAVNVLLALLSSSVLTGVMAFLFSTVLITFLGEIVPQAYFSRHALRMASSLAPVLRIYQFALFPVAKTTALALDKWLGHESIRFFRERELYELLKIHTASSEADIGGVESRGAVNFLLLDDVAVADEGEVIDPRSIVDLEFDEDRPVFPAIERSRDDDFLLRVQASGKKWVILVGDQGEPGMAIHADGFIRDALFGTGTFNPLQHCHRPIVVKPGATLLGDVLPRLTVHPERVGDDVVDDDIILYWGDTKRIITGSDILGRLLRGIVRNEDS